MMCPNSYQCIVKVMCSQKKTRPSFFHTFVAVERIQAIVTKNENLLHLIIWMPILMLTFFALFIQIEWSHLYFTLF